MTATSPRILADFPPTEPRGGATRNESSMHRFKDRVLILGAALVLLGSVLSAGLLGADARIATAEATPPAIPATPVGEQLAWVLDELDGAVASLTEADLIAHASPRFLAELPAPLVLALLRQTAEGYAPITLAGFAYPRPRRGRSPS